MTIDQRALEIALSKKLNMPVRCVHKGRACLEARIPSLFPRGHGFSLFCELAFGSTCNVSMKLDLYGSDILEQWRTADPHALRQAFELLEANKSFHAELIVNDETISDVEEFAIAQKANWDAKSFSLKTWFRNEWEDIETHLALQCLYLSFGFILLLAGVFEGAEPSNEPLEGEIEGGRHEITLSQAERSIKNRRLCIQAHGTKCAACGFDFGKVYGPIAEGFIEVHHLTPLSSLEEPAMIDPVTDMAPLCSNCHAVVHRRNPPLTLNELQELLERNDR